MWQALKNKIVSMLSANTRIQQVFDYEVDNFSGDPVAVLMPSANESAYRSTTANRRIYAFKLSILVKLELPRTAKTAEDTLTELTDVVIDTFDRYYTLGKDANNNDSPGSALVLPTGYTVIRVHATPSVWGYVEREATYRIAEMLIKVEVDVDVSLISGT